VTFARLPVCVCLCRRFTTSSFAPPPRVAVDFWALFAGQSGQLLAGNGARLGFLLSLSGFQMVSL